MFSIEGKRAIFRLSPEVANAWYFVVAHWPDWRTSPDLLVSDGPMRVSCPASHEVLQDVRNTLERAILVGGSMAESAKTLLSEIMAAEEQCRSHQPPADGQAI